MLKSSGFLKSVLLSFNWSRAQISRLSISSAHLSTSLFTPGRLSIIASLEKLSFVNAVIIFFSACTEVLKSCDMIENNFILTAVFKQYVQPVV